jgi:DNA-binding XRE family transcriptional regulator
VSAQTIEIKGNKAVVLPFVEYRYLLDKVEMLEDVCVYDNAKAKLVSGDDELIPSEVVDSLFRGDNPIKVWRNYRNLSQKQLAESSGISQAYLAQIETGKREGGISIYQALAKALFVDLDDLV